MNKEKVFITGGAGYIGSVLIGDLLEKGYKVSCLDNLRYNQKSIFIYANNSNFNFIHGDSRDKGLLKKLVPKSDVVIPLAALVGMPICNKNPEDARSINLEAIKLINEIRSNDQKLIYPNTNSGYGTSDGNTFCTEKDSLEPISIYGKIKCEAEEYLLSSEKDTITLRLATVFGTSPRMRTDLLVNDFVLKAFREGILVLYEKDFKRNYIHVKDVSRCFEHCIRNYDSMKNQCYNLGLDSANLSKIELAEKIKEQIPRFQIHCKEIGEDPDKRNYIVSSNKLKYAGFEAKISLESGIEELIRGYEILFSNDPYQNI